ncbi:anti-ECFsigma factor, ChrR [Cognatiyoonia koreensis]|uniref:Anti-ECFsigma factor, ChrR n=1 Tax=Cognatiyoonia koreensis TaxID=364200 RepID=A0A1I0MHA0_9RHOB|nr:cupin domain-containing protein [Cognatiyoonia koreensis]SEV87735.1 anti-ECFsigma factor, ChrR [Cognatiyoonia koreensis]
MNLNADFSEIVLLHADDIPWRASPMPGVARRMLDRIGDEVARATTIVRYAPDSQFSAHTHSGGEEFIVLEGVFQDEHGDYPAGTYVRNPPTSSHTPGSAEGCVIFVKLWQFDPDDRTQVRVDMHATPTPDRPGVGLLPLFKDAREEVRVETWASGADVAIDAPDGAEFLVLEGDATCDAGQLRPLSWLRLPIRSRLRAKAGKSGARVWMKLGHLPYAQAPAVS